MKYIKTYENENEIFKYWEVTLLRPIFNLSLKKIGVPDDIIEDWDDNYMNEDVSVYVYSEICKHYDYLRGDYDMYVEWSLSSIKNDKNRATFMGKVIIRDFEISANKFNV